MIVVTIHTATHKNVMYKMKTENFFIEDEAKYFISDINRISNNFIYQYKSDVYKFIEIINK